jgi:hypothetical protein
MIRSSAAVLSLLLGACVTSSEVMVNPSAPKATYHSAFAVVHGDGSADMDALIQKEFLRHGFSVSVGGEGQVTGDAQLIVRYADD